MNINYMFCFLCLILSYLSCSSMKVPKEYFVFPYQSRVIKSNMKWCFERRTFSNLTSYCSYVKQKTVFCIFIYLSLSFFRPQIFPYAHALCKDDGGGGGCGVFALVYAFRGCAWIDSSMDQRRGRRCQRCTVHPPCHSKCYNRPTACWRTSSLPFNGNVVFPYHSQLNVKKN